MMPASLLDPRPGERILDLCAAPGGKSTQIAGKMEGRGFLLCNEIHPARAKILSENIERMGVRNACVANEEPGRLAEVFSEYFDRILVDAPCSGEGMFRKNQEACEEWSPQNVDLCATRQDEILECAAKMLRPGGRLVYSTCTFSVEENEGSIRRFLEKHPEYRILPVDKEGLGLLGCDGLCGEESGGTGLSVAEPGQHPVTRSVEDLGETEGTGRMESTGFHMENTVRMWPQRIKGEGHFAAVLEKGGTWPEGYRKAPCCGVVRGIERKELGEYMAFCEENLRIPEPDLRDGGCYIKFGGNLYLVPADMPSMKGLRVLRTGLHMGEVKKNRFEPSHALALALSHIEASRVWNLSSGAELLSGVGQPTSAEQSSDVELSSGVKPLSGVEQPSSVEQPSDVGPSSCKTVTWGETADSGETVSAYLRGQTFPAEGEKGWYLVCVDGFSLGWGKLTGGIMKNHYPKGLRIQG